jgi:branched-chain amino acid transport system ATP-binding protein
MGKMLETIGVSKVFGKLKAVDNVTFSVDEGEIVGLVGPNGAGKSTFFNLISGYYPSDGGQIFFQGKDVTKNKAYQSAELGMCRTFQIVKPFGNMTVLENVMVGAFKHTNDPKVAHKKAEEAIVYMGMENKMYSVANQLTLPDRKRLEIIRAFVTGPTLLMLDEVMAGMNRTEIDEFLPIIRDIRAYGTTIIIVEHVMYVVMNLAERIMVLNEGRQIAEGSPAEIAKDKNVIDAYLGEEYLLAKN